MEENKLDSGSIEANNSTHTSISPSPYLHTLVGDVRNTDHAQLQKSKNKYQCKICKNFFGRYHLPSHVKSQHSEENIFTCKICGEVFKQKYYYTVHRKSHDKLEPPKCEMCGMQFLHRYLLKQHQESHNAHFGRKPFACEICQKNFSTTSGYLRHKKKVHLKVVTNKKYKVYICDFCGKSCISPSLRVIHMRKHTGNFPFHCEKCGKAFPSKKALMIHMQFHTLPFECGLCHVKYSSKIKLLRHLKNHEVGEVNLIQALPTQDYSELIHVQSGFTKDQERTSGNEVDLSMLNLKKEPISSSSITSLSLEYELGVDNQSLAENDITGVINSKYTDKRPSSEKEFSKNEEQDMSILDGNASPFVKGETNVKTELHDFNEGASPPTLSVTQICSYSETNNADMANGSSITSVKLETPISQTINSGQPGDSNVLVMKKLGCFKINKEDLEQIVNGKSLLSVIKSEEVKNCQ